MTSSTVPPRAAEEVEGNVAAAARRAEKRAEELRRLNERVNLDQPDDLDDLDDEEDDQDGPEGDPALMGTDWQSQSLRAQVPDKPVPLRPGELACPGCGQPVQAPPPDRRGDLVKAQLQGAATRAMPGYVADEIVLTRCPACAEVRHRAIQILAAHRGLQSRLGGVAVDVIEVALGCLASCQIGLPTPDAPPAVVNALVKLAGPGKAVRWQGFPFRAIKGRCAPRPWACVPTSARDHASRAAAEWLKLAVQVGLPDREVRLPRANPLPGRIPISSGCLLCGIGSVVASGAALLQGSPWTWHESVSAELLGAHVRSLTKVCGWLCPTCESVWQQERAWGPDIREQAAARHCDAQGREDRATLARTSSFTPPAWGGLVAQAKARKRAVPAVPDRPFGFVVWPGEVKPGTVDPVDAALRALEAAGLRPTALEPVE